MFRRIQELESRLEAATSESERLEILQVLAWEQFRYRGETQNLIEQAHARLQYVDDHTAIINQLALTATESYTKGELEQALEQLNSVILYYQAYGPDDWLCRALGLQGDIFLRIGEYARVLEICQHMQALAEKLGDVREQAFAFIAYGIVYGRLEDYPRALSYFEQGLEMATKNGDFYEQIVVWYHRVTAYLALKQYDAAMNAAEKALALLANTDNTVLTASIYGVLSDVYVHHQDYEKALQVLTIGINILPPHRHIHVIHLNIKLALIHNLMEQPHEAHTLLTRVLATSESMNLKPQISACHQELSTACKLMGDFQQALVHHEQFYAIQKRIFNEESDQRLRTLEVVHRTQQAHAEAEQQRLLRAQDKVLFDQLSKIKDDIIAAVSHDLKSPLSSMGVVLHLLERYVGNDEKVRGYIERLRISMNNMQTLISNLLDLAQLETGHALALKPFAFEPFVSGIIQDHEVMAQDKQISLHIDAHTGDLVAVFDPAQIRRVLDNLLSNAVKYTPVGGNIRVLIEQDKTAIRVQISDSGPGIPQSDLPHLFERFYRVKNPQLSDSEGTGLGLSIAKSIIEKHGGAIWVESEVNKGSTFGFSLPLTAQHMLV